MTQQVVLRRDDISGLITKLYDGDLHAKRVLSLPNATLGVLTSASLAVHAVGQELAQATGKLSKHGVKQVDRLLSNDGIDVDEFFGCWVPYMVGARTEIVVALDWTSFARDGHQTIVLSMLTGHGRATPLMWHTVRASTLKGNQRRYENELLRALRDAMPAGVKVTVVADRGFGNGPFIRCVSEELGFEYVLRIHGDFYVTSAKGERRLASDWVGVKGRSRTLRGATVSESTLAVGTVVCVHAKAMAESWCVVASEEKIATRTLIRYYAKRWGIETSFRDIKDMRFGMGMSAMRIRHTARRDRLLLLSALSIALLTLLCTAGESLGYDRWLKANTVKTCTHSLFRQGLMLYQHIPNWPEHRLRPLVEKFAQMLMEQQPRLAHGFSNSDRVSQSRSNRQRTDARQSPSAGRLDARETRLGAATAQRQAEIR